MSSTTVGGIGGYGAGATTTMPDDDPPTMFGRGGAPPPDGTGPFGRQMQMQQQQQRPATFYETLRVPPTATRAQIKQSYLSLVRMFDGRNGGGGK